MTHHALALTPNGCAAAELDAEHLPRRVHLALQLALRSPNLVPSALERYSYAASTFCKWVRAVDRCARSAHTLAPTWKGLQDSYLDRDASTAREATLAAELKEEEGRRRALRRRLEETTQRRQQLQLQVCAWVGGDRKGKEGGHERGNTS